MPNIWVYVVGGMVTIGAIISVKSIIGDNSKDKTLASQTSKAITAPIKAKVPEPDAIFDKFEVTKDDFSLGKDIAPVTVIEYSSLTCPHCAQFHQAAFPVLKSEFIDTGKVRFVFRDFPLDQVALSGSMVARCAGRNKFFAFIDTLFAQQTGWANDPNPLEALSRIARLGGLSQANFKKCLKDKKIADKIIKQRMYGDKIYAINSTPTIIINGRKFSGGLSVEQLRALLNKLLE